MIKRLLGGKELHRNANKVAKIEGKWVGKVWSLSRFICRCFACDIDVERSFYFFIWDFNNSRRSFSTIFFSEKNFAGCTANAEGYAG